MVVVTRIRPTASGTDRYGSPVMVDVETVLPQAAGFAPGGSSEPAEVGRAPVITEPSLYFWESAPDLLRGDRVRVAGEEFAVEGAPASWFHMFTGWAAGTVVTLKAVSG